jgi:ERO1-like protein alpha
LLIGLKINIVSPNPTAISDLNTKGTIETVSKIYPFLKKLTDLKYFRFFRVDLTKECQYWVSNAMCTQKLSCTLCECPPEKLPLAWLDEDLKLKEATSFNKYKILEHVFHSKAPSMQVKNERENPNIWRLDQINDNSIYVDLHEDLEEYTGFQGKEIWDLIYKENCKKFYDMCTNNKLLYRLISGMHTSVSSHLSYYFKNPITQDASKKHYPNLWLYLSKVGQFEDRITNLIYATSLLMKGISRYANEIKNFKIKLDDLNEELQTKTSLEKMLNILGTIKEREFMHSDIFSKPLLKEEEKNQFTTYFLNIAQIMDCVECQKCKVYGKMQMLGLATALRKLLNEDHAQLTRNELVALINTLKKWCESIQIYHTFQDILYYRKRDMLMCMAAFTLLVILLVRKFKKTYKEYVNSQNRESINDQSEKEKIKKD